MDAHRTADGKPKFPRRNFWRWHQSNPNWKPEDHSGTGLLANEIWLEWRIWTFALEFDQNGLREGAIVRFAQQPGEYRLEVVKKGHGFQLFRMRSTTPKPDGPTNTYLLGICVHPDNDIEELRLMKDYMGGTAFPRFVSRIGSYILVRHASWFVRPALPYNLGTPRFFFPSIHTRWLIGLYLKLFKKEHQK